jgi:hypothetical protein
LTTITVADLGLAMQGWAGQTEPDQARLIRPSRSPRPTAKPPKGFFTSSWDSERRSTAWLDFMRSTGQRHNEGRWLWTLAPDPDARVYVIDGWNDYRRLADAYPQRYENERNPHYAPAWHHVAALDPLPFDAVHVTARATQLASGQGPDDHPQFSDWDVESTLWLAWRLCPQECIGTIASDWTVTES